MKSKISKTDREKFIDRCMKLLEWDQYTREHSKGKLSAQWCVGGQSGGSCWDDGAQTHYALSPSPEPEFEELDKLLEMIRPEISHLQYKTLVRELLKYNECREDDYYGNFTDYKNKTLDLGELYDYLLRNDLLNCAPSMTTAVADLNGLLAAMRVSTVDEALELIQERAER